MIGYIIVGFFFLACIGAIINHFDKPKTVINNYCCKECLANTGKDNIIPEIDEENEDNTTARFHKEGLI